MSDQEYEVTILDYELPKRKEPYKKAFYFRIMFEQFSKFKIKRVNPSEITLYLLLVMWCTQQNTETITFRSCDVYAMSTIRPCHVHRILEALEIKGFVTLYSYSNS